jgi:hypothetical protein
MDRRFTGRSIQVKMAGSMTALPSRDSGEHDFARPPQA